MTVVQAQLIAGQDPERAELLLHACKLLRAWETPVVEEEVRLACLRCDILLEEVTCTMRYMFSMALSQLAVQQHAT